MIGVDGGVRRATTSKLSASAGDDHPADASPERPYVGKTIRPASQILFFFSSIFQRIILTSKGHTGANADKHFHLISSSSRIDKRLRLSRSTLRPQLTTERSSHWDTAMLRGDGDNANIRISIESHKDGCYENNQLTPAFNSLTAVYNNTQCCHRNTRCIGKVSCIIIFHGN